LGGPARIMATRPARRFLDLGCGTGSLSLLLAQHGHHVVGVDLSPRMVEHAHHKLTTAGYQTRFLVGDAGDSPALGHGFDVVLARHLLWTLPDPTDALRRLRCRPAALAARRRGRPRPLGSGYRRRRHVHPGRLTGTHRQRHLKPGRGKPERPSRNPPRA
jgi:SAM-dependent methyltransferase